MKRTLAILLILIECALGLEPAFAGAPTCWPDAKIPLGVYWQKLPSGASSTMEYVAVWSCKTPNGGAENEVYAFSRKEIEQYLAPFLHGVFNEADATATCAKTCQTYRGDTSLTLAMRSLSQPFLAHAEVRANGPAKDRPVYALNPDGTRKGEAEQGARVAVGARCNHAVSVGGGFFRVDGQRNVASSDPDAKLGAVVAMCVLTTPLPPND